MKHLVFLLLFIATPCIAQTPSSESISSNLQPTRETYLKLGAEVANALHSDVLDVWFPRSVDNKFGGFHSHFGRDWKDLPSDGKFSVFQGRMTWVAAQVVLREPAMKGTFIPIVHNGVDFLANAIANP
jgi:mannose/cellobiose epimerase-like protein (N-acyl-D-glucosamine 2-epimerase family)